MKNVKRYYSEIDLEAYSGISRRTLQGWRLRAQGPPWRRLGGSVRYDIEAFEQWVTQCPSGGQQVA